MKNELTQMIRCPWDGKLYKSELEFPPMPKEEKAKPEKEKENVSK